jgi:hypothetical protein
VPVIIKPCDWITEAPSRSLSACPSKRRRRGSQRSPGTARCRPRRGAGRRRCAVMLLDPRAEQAGHAKGRGASGEGKTNPCGWGKSAGATPSCPPCPVAEGVDSAKVLRLPTRHLREGEGKKKVTRREQVAPGQERKVPSA